MGYTEIKQNISELSERERRELVAYIVQLEELTEESYIDRITDRIDDTENFVSTKKLSIYYAGLGARTESNSTVCSQFCHQILIFSRMHHMKTGKVE